MFAFSRIVDRCRPFLRKTTTRLSPPTRRNYKIPLLVVTLSGAAVWVTCARAATSEEDKLLLRDQLVKHFRKFASVDVGDEKKKPKMTYDDFLRANGFEPEEFSHNQLAQKIFKLIDHRNNGFVTMEEYISFALLVHSSDAELRLAFFDLFGEPNLDKQITLNEFRRVLDKKAPGLELEFPTGTLEKYFGKNGKKTVGFYEFCKLLRDVEDATFRHDFYICDKKKNGTITTADFTQILSRHSDSVPDYVTTNISKFLASRENHVITFHEFVSFNEIMRNLVRIEETLKNCPKKINREIYTEKITELGILLDPKMIGFTFEIFDKDVEGNIKLEEFFEVMKQHKYHLISPPQQISFFWSFIFGTIAAAIACTCVYPLDKVKTRIQSGGGNIFYVLRNIVTKEGPIYLFRGLSPQIAMIGPANAAQLAANDFGHRFFRGDNTKRELTLFETIMSGVGAGFVEVALCNPQEVVKIRMQMQGQPGIPLKSATGIIMDLGVFGLYKGVTACAMRDLPFNVFYFTIYELLKRRMAPTDSEIGAHGLLTAGIIAGSITAALVTPADTIKTRLQTGQHNYSGVYTCLVDTYTNHGGIKALFRGTVPRVLIIGPMFGIQLMVFELLQRYFFPDNSMQEPVPLSAFEREGLEHVRRKKLEQIERNLAAKYGLGNKA